MGNTVKTTGLTETQARFVVEYVATGDVQRASALAGYTDNAGGYAALRRPEVQAAIKQETYRSLYLDKFPAALRYLSEVVNDLGLEHRLRVEASKAIIKATLDFEKLHSSHATASSQKPLDQQSPEELRQHLERLQQELANRANPVIDAPITRQSDAK